MPGLPWLAEGLEKLGDKLVSKAENSTVGRGILNLTGNQEWELELHPGGRAIKAMQSEYVRLHAAALKHETEKIAKLREWHSSAQAARAALPIKTATLGDYHAHATAVGHPIQHVTGSMLNKDTVGMTQQELIRHAENTSRLTALAGSYGPNYEHATPIIATMLKDPNPDVVQNAHRIADIISNQTHDTQELQNVSSSGSFTGSYAKYSMNKSFKKANSLLKETGERQIPTLSENPTYEKGKPAEHIAHRALDTVMLPLLAVKHIGQTFNVPASSPLTAIGRTLLGMDKQNMKATIEASGIIASTMHSAIYRDILGESGHLADWTNSPTVGKILARIIHQPGFTWMRRKQLTFAASVGFHSTIQWAHEFASNGNRYAAERLKEMGIDLSDVIKQQGKLTQDQLSKGVFHFTNDRMFMDKGINRSLWQNKNVIARAGFMYHGFVNSQASYMRKELMLMAKTGNYKALAQYAGTMTVLFPAMAPLLAGLEKTLTTGSVTQGAQDVKNRYERLNPARLGSAPMDWLAGYIDLLSHIGATGVYFNYMNAIKGHRFASALAGPIVGMVTTDATDIYDAIHKGTKQGAAPLERDALRQLVPIVGGPLSHQLVPTKQEEGGGARRGSSRSRRGFHRGRRR